MTVYELTVTDRADFDNVIARELWTSPYLAYASGEAYLKAYDVKADDIFVGCADFIVRAIDVLPYEEDEGC